MPWGWGKSQWGWLACEKALWSSSSSLMLATAVRPLAWALRGSEHWGHPMVWGRMPPARGSGSVGEEAGERALTAPLLVPVPVADMKALLIGKECPHTKEKSSGKQNKVSTSTPTCQAFGVA